MTQVLIDGFWAGIYFIPWFTAACVGFATVMAALTCTAWLIGMFIAVIISTIEGRK